ncbi:MAG TPA: hypothetical protein VNK52_11700 [Hyphomicrobiaceae bacterium]|nr:hypothetical protein [Hyphomicrobiaceae bacterium]
MATWVKCTGSDGRAAFLNIERAVSMRRESASGPTRVLFDGGQEVAVREEPERILDDDFEDVSDDED